MTPVGCAEDRYEVGVDTYHPHAVVTAELRFLFVQLYLKCCLWHLGRDT